MTFSTRLNHLIARLDRDSDLIAAAAAILGVVFAAGGLGLAAALH